MPMRFWASALVLLALTGCADARPAMPSRPTTAILRLTLAGRSADVKVTLDGAEVDAGGDHVVTPLGTRGAFLLLADSYASRGQAMARCQAGHETWIRLIDTQAHAERWSGRVESCLHDIQPGDPAAAWDASGTGFRVYVLTRPTLHLMAYADGRIVAVDTPSGSIAPPR